MYRDLDAAMSNLERGFGSGDVQAIAEGIAGDRQVELQFPGLIDQNGFFGRDQAAYLFDQLFNKVRPSGFERVSARKVSAEGQYHIVGRWSIAVNGKPETRELYITLRFTDNQWSIVSVRTNP